MKNMYLIFLAMALPLLLHAQADFYTGKKIETDLKRIASGQKDLSKVSSIGKSAGGEELWMLTFSTTPDSPKPALVLVAGADGGHPAGTTLLMSLAEKFAAFSRDTLDIWLKNRSVYIIPCLSPDALNAYGQKPYAVKRGNAAKTDDDRDGRIGEDPFEDLNKDGFITQMRIEDPTGEYILSPDDERLLIKADIEKGQAGRYRLLTEGIDNDLDGKFNEDGSGGVNIDRNFTYNYPVFSEGAGIYTTSESETRAFLEFLNRNQEIFAVISIGPANNLSEAVKYDPKLTSDRILKGWLEKDTKVSAAVSKLYNDKTGTKNAPKMPLQDGSLAQTVYYHAGKYSFSTPGWWVPALRDEKNEEKDSTQVKERKEDKKPGAGDLRLLKWADREGVENVYFEWQEIAHPDFSGQKVEVGGIFPLSRLNPPRKYMEEAAEGHLDFVASFLKAMPEVEISPARVESLGGGINRVTVRVYNKGLLPTYSEVGEKIKFTSKMKTELKIADKQQILSGKKMNLSGPLMPGECMEYSWLIAGKGEISIEAGCASAGRRNLVINLK